MKCYKPRRSAADAVSRGVGRPATAIVHDDDDARLVVFRIEPGQEVPPHRSPSTVLLSVIQGAGTFTGQSGDCEVGEGDLMAYEPDELHGMRATRGPFTVLATITPRPGTRQSVVR